MKKYDLIDYIAPILLTLTVLCAGFLWSRAVNRGSSFSQAQRRMFLHAALFTPVTLYVILFQDSLGELVHFKQSWIFAVALWSVLTTYMVWFRGPR